MLRTLVTRLVLAGAVALGLACASTPEPAPAEASGPFQCAAPRQSLLWEVEREQGSLYLFGSIHIGQPEFYPLPEPVEAAYGRSDHLVLELDPTSSESMQAAMEMARRGMLPAGQTLADVVEPDVRQRVLALASEVGLPAAAVERMRPWLVAITLSAVDLQRMGYAPEDGVEFHFLGNLGEREILELESIEEQLALFEQIDGPVFLDYTLESMDEGREVAVKLMSSWYCGDEEALVALMLEPDAKHAGDPGFAEFMDAMFYERNVGMADGIASLLDQPGHYFVVVGAGHLIGDRGIPALLRDRGFTVERR